MVQEVEITGIDLRYESYRMRNRGIERELFVSIAEQGIREPIEGVDTKEGRILLDGFKRLRCARKLGIFSVPYSSLGEDEAMGIIQLIRISNKRGLSILEQAKLIEELRGVHKMCASEIAGHLERSKSWVSVRLGIISQMSPVVRKKVFNGSFPLYSYMYTLRRFIRINCTKKGEVDEFVNAVAGKNLSIRDIEWLAHGYFKGPDEFRKQIRKGDISWGLSRLKEAVRDSDNCSKFERGMLNDLEIIQKYMQRVTYKSKDTRFKNNSFYAQANLLAAGILSKVAIFSRALRDFYDRTGQA